MTAYDPQNPFAKILRGEFPCYKVYENDHVLAFLDIMPRCPGHTLVIPKAPARNILDISSDDFAQVARGAHAASPRARGRAARKMPRCWRPTRRSWWRRWRVANRFLSPSLRGAKRRSNAVFGHAMGC